MHRVAESLAEAEVKLGLNSVLADPNLPETWEQYVDADVHVVHTHFPCKMKKRLTKPLRLVWVGHGTPDHVFQSAVQEMEKGQYGHGDAIQLTQHWLKTAHARVTFWERHAYIYDRMLTAGARPTDVLPMGVDLSFWKGGVTAGKYAGEPSVFTAENPHYIKWPYDLMTAWPLVADEYPEARLHAIYLPRDMHRAFFPWFNAMGSNFTSFVTPGIFDKAWLKNAFVSTDYTVGLVRYGDINHLSMQANAAGAKTISYPGNPHSDFWVAEGDQRVIASELLEIFRGDRAPRRKEPVADISDTAQAMKLIYEDIAP